VKYILPLLFLGCLPEPKAIEPVPVIIAVESYGDIKRVYIRNDGVECWVYEDGELIRKERY
jgi:hypothetical protein